MGEEVTGSRDEDMTGAELKIIREQCGLTFAEFGELAGVADKSVRGWETTTEMRVPVDVADMARDMHVNLLEMKATILDEYKTAKPGDEVVLNLWRRKGRSADSVALRNSAAGLAFHDLVDDGISVWVEWV